MADQGEDAVRKSAALYALTRHDFRFLQGQYGYRIRRAGVEDPEDYGDATAEVVYLSAHMAVYMGWYFDGAAVGVSFIEVPTPWTLPPTWNFIGTDPTAPRAIDLLALAELRGQGNDADFLLGDSNPRCLRRASCCQNVP